MEIVYPYAILIAALNCYTVTVSINDEENKAL